MSADRQDGLNLSTDSIVPEGDHVGAPLSRDELFRAAMHDSLTGLANRQSFRERLVQELAERDGGGAAVLLIDLDRFKAVNDTLGHPVGDELLRKVADRLRSLLAEHDLLARLGGDEFGMMAAVNTAELQLRATRVLDLLGRPFLIEGHQVNVGASIGIALAPEDGTSYERLMKSADLALYSVKEAGRNGFRFFDVAMEERAQARRAMELALRRALALRQFEVHYLPRVDVETRTLLGMEALVRWRHPDRGLLKPEEFMPLAEEIGVAAAIGRWALKTACKQATEWANDAHVAVSVSSVQFEEGSLLSGVLQALAAVKLRPDRLELEITEGVLLRNEAHVLKTLQDLKQAGVRIGMKNFGTGYASLSRLVSFPFDRIRIDRSIADEAMIEPTQRAMVSAVAALGVSLGVHTMLEGISSREHLARVRGANGGSVRGFLVSEPVAPEQLAGMLREHGGPAVARA